MEPISLDWRLHAPMVFRILKDLKYFEHCGVTFEMRDSVIYREGGAMYAPSRITSFREAQSVLRDNACAGTPHSDAICLLEGVSWYPILDKGRELLRRMRMR